MTEFLLDGRRVLGLLATTSPPAGGTTIVSVPWDTRVVHGEHTIGVTADRTALVIESNKANNSTSLTVTVRGNKVSNGAFE